MNILLIAINENNRVIMTPLALLYLEAGILNDPYLKVRTRVDIKEFSVSDKDKYILSEIQKSDPQVVGFSCYVWNIQRVLDLASKIKRAASEVRIVLGGPQVSPIAREVLKENADVDIIVKGEGEISFLKLSRALVNNRDELAGLQGIIFRDKGEVIDNPDREIIPDLDALPSAYAQGFIPLNNREVCLETQRGCIFKCHFCYYNKSFSHIRFFSLKRVKRELAFLLKQDLKGIYLMDPVFNVNGKRAKEICRFIIRHNKRNVPFHTEIKAELVDAEMAELFHKANMKYLEIGLQSSKRRVLHGVNRKLDIKKFVRGVNLLKNYDMRSEVHLILGLPNDTLVSFKRSLEFVLKLAPPSLSIFNLQVLPGTEIRRKVKRLGMVHEKAPPYYLLHSRGFPLNKMLEAQRIINSVNLFRKKIAIKYLCIETKTKLLDLISVWIDWLEDEEFLLKPQKSRVLRGKLRGFVRYLCIKNSFDPRFYDNLIKKEFVFSTQSEREQQS
jgi:radical SAM superfamily enzyme YgiQ (UPF0313 family)